jgi:hypothetical protein
MKVKTHCKSATESKFTLLFAGLVPDPYQRRFANSPPKNVAKKEELVFTPPIFAPFPVVPEEGMTLLFLVDGPTDLGFVEVLAFLWLVVVLANAFREVYAGIGVCA